MCKKILLLIALAWSLIACSSNEPTETTEDYFFDCKYSAPEPIFTASTVGIISHQFELQTQVGIERVEWENGLQMTIQQQGCNEIVQFFEFRVNGKFDELPESHWVQQAGQYFYYIGSTDEQYLPLYEWGELMIQNASSMSLGKDFEVYPDFFIQVSKKTFEDHILLVTRLATIAEGIE